MYPKGVSDALGTRIRLGFARSDLTRVSVGAACPVFFRARKIRSYYVVNQFLQERDNFHNKNSYLINDIVVLLVISSSLSLCHHLHKADTSL